MTLIGIATPAWASPPDFPTTPPPTTVPADAPGFEAPDFEEGTSPDEDILDTAGTGTPTPTPPAFGGAGAVNGEGVTPDELSTFSTTPPAVGGVPGPDSTSAPSGVLLDDLRAFMASAGILFPDTDDLGAEDFVVNPLGLTFTCTPDGTSWKLANNGPDALGVGWFDTDLGGSFVAVSGGQTVDLPSNALAVIAHPVDAEGNVLVTVPAVGVSSCAGSTGTTGTPVAVPAAAPATPVKAEPYYTG